MGFPIIMYLSKSKVKRFLDRKKDVSISSVKPSIGFGLSPSISVEASIERGFNDRVNYWPPHDSLDMVVKIENKLKKKGYIGTINDFLNDVAFPCYKLKGKIYIPSQNEQQQEYYMHYNLIGQGVEGIFIPEGTDRKVWLTLSYENIAGVIYNDEKWNILESGARFLFRDAMSSGFSVIGLFTYEGEKEGFFAQAGILYFARMDRFWNNDKKLKDSIFNDYTNSSKQ